MSEQKMGNKSIDELSDDELLAELGIEKEEKQSRLYTPEEERVIAGFEDISRFFDQYGRAPMHGEDKNTEDKDIFEQLYAVRLDALRESEKWCSFLKPFDKHHLLDEAAHPDIEVLDLDDDALLSALGVGALPSDDLQNLRHVRPFEERRQNGRTSPDDIASRKAVKDFNEFAPLFQRVERDLKQGIRKRIAFGKDVGMSDAKIKQGQFFILSGLIAYIDAIGAPIKAPNGENDSRLRVIFSNGMESDLLLRSLQRALYKDEGGMRISEPEIGPLFTGEIEADDLASGFIYVLRSNSPHPEISKHRDFIHKIGVTGGKIESRIAMAKNDPTFLMDDVEIVATYELYNISRMKMEKLLHRVFHKAQFDITIHDRFGKPIHPQEWFLVPLSAIDEAVERLKDNSLINYQYEPSEGALKRLE